MHAVCYQVENPEQYDTRDLQAWICEGPPAVRRSLSNGPCSRRKEESGMQLHICPSHLATVMVSFQAIVNYLDIHVLEQDMALEAAMHPDSESDA